MSAQRFDQVIEADVVDVVRLHGETPVDGEVAVGVADLGVHVGVVGEHMEIGRTE